MAFGHLKVPDNYREHVLEVLNNTPLIGRWLPSGFSVSLKRRLIARPIDGTNRGKPTFSARNIG
jgi:hypothetical protein